MFLYFSQHASGWAIGFTKISIACMLFRLQQDDRYWRVFLYLMMLVSLVIAVTTSAVLFSACRPVSAMWGHSIPHAVCLPMDVVSIGILLTAAITILTDIVLSLLPLTFIIKIRRSLRERILIVCLMGLGLIAASASVCKIVLVSKTNLTGMFLDIVISSSSSVMPLFRRWGPRADESNRRCPYRWHWRYFLDCSGNTARVSPASKRKRSRILGVVRHLAR